MPRIFIMSAALVIILCACGGNAPEPSAVPASEVEGLIFIEGIELGIGEIVFLISDAMDEYARFYDVAPDRIDWRGQIGGLNARRYLLERALELAVNAYAAKFKAAELGFGLTEEEEDEIDWGIAMDIDSLGGREAFLEMVGSEELYRFYTYIIPILREKMLESLFGYTGEFQPDGAALWHYFMSNYTSAAFIFLSGTDAYGDPLDDDEWELQKSVAGALRRQAAETDELGFFRLIREHDQSYPMMIYPEGMAVPHGMLGELFDQALQALPVGGMSDVVVTEDGFYIILRLPEDVEWFESHIEEIWYYCSQELFLDKIEEWGRELDVEVNAAYWDIDPLEVVASG
jgi:hypothetical protein